MPAGVTPGVHAAQSPRRLCVGVFFGGKSGEHEVSLASGTTVMEHLDPARYRVCALGIRKDGSPAPPEESSLMLRKPLPSVETPDLVIRPAEAGRFIRLAGRDGCGGEFLFDVIFPVLHGTFGEDGTIQGLLEMAEVPYVGCNVLGSSLGMDKDVCKAVFRAAGLPVAPYFALYRHGWQECEGAVRRRVLDEIGLPCFVKPARLGSSVGVRKVGDMADLGSAVENAFAYDYKILVERGVDAREIECSVMGMSHIRSSPPGEIVPSREFYDYRAKYADDDSELVLPADLPSDVAERVGRMAETAFRAVGGEGFARVDFLLDRLDGTPYVNEINTIPGFTSISMFPKLWSLAGVGLPRLLDELIGDAMERHGWKSALRTTFQLEENA